MSTAERQPAALPELMGNTEVCRTLGVLPSNLDKVVGLPEPRYKLIGGRLWLADEVREFAAARRRRLGK